MSQLEYSVPKSRFNRRKTDRCKGESVSLWKDLKVNRELYLMMTPFMVLFLIFIILPVAASIFLSFTNYNLLQIPEWKGFLNYKRLFLDDDVFLISVRNTLVFAFVTGPLSYFMCFIFAWLINELQPKVRSFVTLIFYAPAISGNVFFIWQFIFSGDIYGMMNGTLMKLNMIQEPIQWLTDARYNLTIIMVVQLWMSLGTSFLAFIAGLQSVDDSLYEAGSIDGIKNRWQELWYITLPSMKPQLLFGAIMQIAVSFSVSTVSMSLAGFPSNKYSAHTIVLHIMDYGTIRYEMGYASAIAVVLFITMVITTRLIQRILKSVGN